MWTRAASPTTCCSWRDPEVRGRGRRGEGGGERGEEGAVGRGESGEREREGGREGWKERGKGKRE